MCVFLVLFLLHFHVSEEVGCRESQQHVQSDVCLSLEFPSCRNLIMNKCWQIRDKEKVSETERAHHKETFTVKSICKNM